jgi:predicted nucleic acid-binding protein
VDASIAVQWFVREPGAESAAALIESDDVLMAPDLMPVEAANAWWRKVRRGEMSPIDLEGALVTLLASDIRWMPVAHLLPRAARLAVEVGHSVYDCLYLTLATGWSARLATRDRRLAALAERLRVSLWTP